MPNESISRRDILRTLAVTAAGSGLKVIPTEAAEYVHQMVHKEKAAAPAGAYTPKYFSASQYATLTFLCDTIIPKDEKSGGAVEAGAPEFIDLLTSENPEYQLRLGGGFFWLDAACSDRYSKVFMECTLFFSSRSLHSICSRDWSSDVCSSDLKARWASFLRSAYVVAPPLAFISSSTAL